MDCKHAKRFRYAKDGTEFCAICAQDRTWKSLLEEVKKLCVYKNFKNVIDIETPESTKVVMWFPFNGYEFDQEQLKKLGIKLGDVFTVDYTVVHSSSTELFLKEFPGKSFNHVHFAYA